MDAGSLSAVMSTAQKLARAVMKAFSADGVTVQQFNEPAGGQVVFHLHVHIIPRCEGVALKPPGGPMEQPEILAANAEKIRAALALPEGDPGPEHHLGDDDAEQHALARYQIGGKAGASAPTLNTSDVFASAPLGNMKRLPMTAATSAVATARTRTRISDSSAMRPPRYTPRKRQASVAAQPATRMKM